MSIQQMQIQEKDIPSLMKEGKENEMIALLYKQIFPKVKSYILKQNGRREDAYDMFQDAILYFYKQVLEDRFNEKYTVYGYVYKLSINRWINKIKRDQKLQLVDVMPENIQETEDDQFKELDLYMNSKALIDVIFSEVGDKCKEILTYAICYDMLIEDIMLRMGMISEGATKMQIKRCKEKLYKAVEENQVQLKKLRWQ